MGCNVSQLPPARSHLDIIIFMFVDLLSPASSKLYLRLFFLFNEIMLAQTCTRCLSTRLTHPQPVTKHLPQGTIQSPVYKRLHAYVYVCVTDYVWVCVCMRAWHEQQWHAKLPSSTSTWATKEPASQPSKQATACIANIVHFTAVPAIN